MKNPKIIAAIAFFLLTVAFPVLVFTTSQEPLDIKGIVLIGFIDLAFLLAGLSQCITKRVPEEKKDRWISSTRDYDATVQKEVDLFIQKLKDNSKAYSNN